MIEALRAKPAMMVLGERDRTLPAVLVKDMLREVWPDAPFIRLLNVSHFAQEAAPEPLVARVDQLVRTHWIRFGEHSAGHELEIALLDDRLTCSRDSLRRVQSRPLDPLRSGGGCRRVVQRLICSINVK